MTASPAFHPAAPVAGSPARPLDVYLAGVGTVGRALLGLAPVTEGSVRYAGRDIGHLSRGELSLGDDPAPWAPQAPREHALRPPSSPR